MNPVDQTLLTVIMVMGLTFAVSWAGMGRGMQLAPRASYRFAAANLCIAAGMVLTVRRADFASFLHYQVSDWLLLLGLLAFRSGTQLMVHGSGSRWSLWLPFFVAVVATAPLESAPSSNFSLAMVFATVAAWITLDNARLAYQGLLANEFSRKTAAAISSPFLAAGLVFVSHGAKVLLQGFQPVVRSEVTSESPATLLWMMGFLLLVVNLAMAALAGTRLMLRIRQLAERDHLTGCWNRRMIEARLQLEFDRNRRSGEHLSCVFLDVDHFKKVNDTRGHEAGDAALVHVGKLLGEKVRKVDMVGRYGGEEFVVVLPSTHLTGAREAAEKLRVALQGSPVVFGADSFSITASFGVATLTGAETLEQLLKRADTAMYAAKAGGRNRVEVAP